MKLNSAIRAIKKLDGKFTRRAINITSDRLSIIGFEYEFKLSIEANEPMELKLFEELSLIEDSIKQTSHPIACDNDDIAINVSSKELCESAAWCANACDTESTRYALGGVCFEASSMVATDGRRLHVVECHNFNSLVGQSIVPKATIDCLCSLVKACGSTKDLKIVFLQNSVMFYGANWSLKTLLVDGRYPDWKRVVPDCKDHSSQTITAEDVETCKQTIKRVAIERKLAWAKLTKSERKGFVDGTPMPMFSVLNGCMLDCNFLVESMIGIKLPTTLLFKGHAEPEPCKLIRDDGSFAVIMPVRTPKAKK